MSNSAILLDKLYRFAVDLIAPNRCPFCERVITWNSYFCADCVHKIDLCGDELCRHCGKASYNCICSEGFPSYDECICVSYYVGDVCRAVLRMKESLGDNSTAFSQMMYRKLDVKCDLVISVPMTKVDKRKRGYNQSSLMAKRIAMLTNTPFSDKLLIKERKTQKQKTMSKAQRAENVKQAYKITNSDAIKGKSVLLVDDVLTTGNTLNECAKMLKLAGAKHVVAAVFTTTKLDNNKNQQID